MARTVFWFTRNRRLAKDHENLAATLTTFVTLAAVQLGIRRLARAPAEGRDPTQLPRVVAAIGPASVTRAGSMAVAARRGYRRGLDLE